MHQQMQKKSWRLAEVQREVLYQQNSLGPTGCLTEDGHPIVLGYSCMRVTGQT